MKKREIRGFWADFSLPAHVLRPASAHTKDAARRMALVEAVRTLRFHRDDFDLPGPRAMHGRHASAGQRMKSVERVLR